MNIQAIKMEKIFWQTISLNATTTQRKSNKHAIFLHKGINNYCDNSDCRLKKRCIFCPQNGSIAEMNDQVMDFLPGEEKIFNSAGIPNQHEEDGHIPIEFLNTLNCLSCSKHQLSLKSRMILICVKNINKINVFVMANV